MYAVFKFGKGAKEIEEIYKDDIVSRQTLIKRDGASLGLENATYLLVEGSEDAIKRAREIAGDYEITGEEAEDVYKKIKEAEDAASLGMGAIFG